MNRKVAITLAAAAGMAAAALLYPGWGAGRAVDKAGWGILYGYRNAPAVTDSIVVVEIDDEAVAELGPWPWDEGTTKKIFEAPFVYARRVVNTVSAKDMGISNKSAEAYYRGLSALGAVEPVEAINADMPPLEVAYALNRSPAGGQGELLRRQDVDFRTIAARLPEWRSLVLRSMAYRYVKGNDEATKEGFVSEVAEPYWKGSEEVARLAGFWYEEAQSAKEVMAEAGVEGFAAEEFEDIETVDYAWFGINASGASAVGLSGVEQEWSPFASGVTLLGEKPFLRLGIAAAGTVKAYKKARLSGRRLIVERPSDGPWEVELDKDGMLAVNCTGNRRIEWYAGFRRFSAAVLVEMANARRALWDGFAAYEASVGEGELPGLLSQYESAADGQDYALMEKASRKIFARVGELREMVRSDRQRVFSAEVEEDAEEAGIPRDPAKDVLELESDYQVLRDMLVDAFRNRVVVIVPGARQFESIQTPWGREVPAAAVDVSILNGIFTGVVIERAPAWAWWAAALGGAVLGAVAAGRLGTTAGGVVTAVILGGALFGWWLLFVEHSVLMGLSSAGGIVCGYAAGAALYMMTTGRERRRVGRLLSGRLPQGQSAGIIRRLGRSVLRREGEAAVLAIGFSRRGGAGEDAALRRYARVVKDVILGLDGVALDAVGDIEGGFGWVGPVDAVEGATAAGLVVRQRLKMHAEKLAAEGSGEILVKMGVGAGEGRLSTGLVSGEALWAGGEAFDSARSALEAAVEHDAGMVIPASDAERFGANHELRRLDAEGAYYEILERKGALSVTMRRVRELYESALVEAQNHETEVARGHLLQALSEMEDGPSRKLLERLSGAGSGV